MFNSLKEKYSNRFSQDAVYRFSDDDFNRIQVLINELRDLINNSQVITAKHKQRLLERLERMQREWHKQTSDLDRFWGFIGEAGIVIGRFGTNIKPIVNRLREIAEIVWKTIRVNENLLGTSNPITLPEVDNTIDDNFA